jgi:hypothetical protein
MSWLGYRVSEMINCDGPFRNSRAWKYNHRSVRMSRAFVNDKLAIDNNRAMRTVKAVRKIYEGISRPAISRYFFI